MRWFISLIFSSLCSGQIIIMTQYDSSAAKHIHNRLLEFYHLPKSMVATRRGACHLSERETVLCINKKGELKLSSINQAQIKSFKIFK